MSNLDANGNPVTVRPSGWYLVRRKLRSGLHGDLDLNGWECARWDLAARLWYSVDWFGEPDCNVVCGSRIEMPAHV